MAGMERLRITAWACWALSGLMLLRAAWYVGILMLSFRSGFFRYPFAALASSPEIKSSALCAAALFAVAELFAWMRRVEAKSITPD